MDNMSQLAYLEMASRPPLLEPNADMATKTGTHHDTTPSNFIPNVWIQGQNVSASGYGRIMRM